MKSPLARTHKPYQNYRIGLTSGPVDRAEGTKRGTMVTRCYLCGGKTELRRITAENWWGDQLALVENVPA